MAKGKVGTLSIDLIARTGKLFKGLNKAGNAVKRFESKTNKALKSVSSGFFSLKNAVFAVAAAMSTKGLFSVNAEIEKLEITLEVVTGSALKAEIAFALIRKTAEQLPETIKDVGTAFVRMKSLGLNPTEKALISFGNTASAMGKSLIQFIEAVADATTGEFERLKEFGIKSKTEGDKISFRFQGVTTSVGNNAQEINDYLRSIGENQFAGAATKQMDTMSGRVSNLKLAFEDLLLTVGKNGFNQLSKTVLISMTDIVKTVKEKFDAIKFVGAELFGFLAIQGLRFKASWEQVFTSAFGVVDKLATAAKRAWATITGGNLDDPSLRYTDIGDQVARIRMEELKLKAEILASVEATKQAIIQEGILATAKQKTLEAAAPKDTATKATPKDIGIDKQQQKLNAALAREIDSIAQALMTEEQRITESYDRRSFMVETAYQNDIVSWAKRNELIEALDKKHQQALNDSTEKSSSQRTQVMAQGLNAAAGIMNSLTSLIGSSSKKQFDQGKKLARASAIVSTAAAVMSALEVKPYPLGVALAIGAAAKGAAQLATINRTSYGGGGGVSTGGISFPSPTVNQQPVTTEPQDSGSQVINVNITVQGNVTSEKELADKVVWPYLQDKINNKGATLIEKSSDNAIELAS